MSTKINRPGGPQPPPPRPPTPPPKPAYIYIPYEFDGYRTLTIGDPSEDHRMRRYSGKILSWDKPFPPDMNWYKMPRKGHLMILIPPAVETVDEVEK